MRKCAAALLLLLLPAAFLLAEGTELSFDWAFVKRGPGGAPRPIDFSERVSIAQGDLFKIHVQPVKNAFLYLFLHDAGGDLQRLFPASFKDFEARDYSGRECFIPDGENWFTLDGAKGTERFYLLASAKRLTALEGLSDAYERAAQQDKAARRQAVLDEIARLRTSHSALKIAAEKPVTIAGGTRGMNASVAKLATRVEAEEFYSKTFRLDH
jgi:hypothetical protein